MDEENVSRKLYEIERYFADSDELPDEEIIDTDELIDREEDQDTPAAMPPESLEDFEKAIRGGQPPALPSIPPSNPD